MFVLTLGWADKGSSTWWGGERDEGRGGRKGCTASLTELCGVNTQTLLLGSPASQGTRTAIRKLKGIFHKKSISRKKD